VPRERYSCDTRLRANRHLYPPSPRTTTTTTTTTTEEQHCPRGTFRVRHYRSDGKTEKDKRGMDAGEQEEIQSSSPVETFLAAFQDEFASPESRARVVASWRRQLLPPMRKGSGLVPDTLRVSAVRTVALSQAYVAALLRCPLALELSNKCLGLFKSAESPALGPALLLGDLSAALCAAATALVHASPPQFSNMSVFSTRFVAKGFLHNAALEGIFPREALLIALILDTPELRDVWWSVLPRTWLFRQQLLLLPRGARCTVDTVHAAYSSCHARPVSFSVFRRLGAVPGSAQSGLHVRTVVCRCAGHAAELGSDPRFHVAATETRRLGLPFWCNSLEGLALLAPPRMSTSLVSTSLVSTSACGGVWSGRLLRVSCGQGAYGYVISDPGLKARCILYADVDARCGRGNLGGIHTPAFLYPVAAWVLAHGGAAGRGAFEEWCRAPMRPVGYAPSGVCTQKGTKQRPNYVSMDSDPDVNSVLKELSVLEHGAPPDLVRWDAHESGATLISEYVVGYEPGGLPIALGQLPVCVYAAGCGGAADYRLPCVWAAMLGAGW
jgi:hypothetical protein